MINQELRINLGLVCPLFDEERTIENLVSTLNAQSDLDFCVIFVDGGSSDSTLGLLEAAVKLFPSTIVSYPNNLGISQNWARAATHALMDKDATHFAFVASDDKINSRYIRSMKEKISIEPSSVYVPVFLFEKEGSLIEMPAVSGTSALELILRWDLVMLTFSVFNRSFFENQVLQTLFQCQTAAFDWWVAREVLRCERTVSVPRAEYIKTQHERNHESAHYLGGSVEHRKNRRLIPERIISAWFSYPLVTGRKALEALTPSRNHISHFEKYWAVGSAIAKAYREVFRRLLARKIREPGGASNNS